MVHSNEDANHYLDYLNTIVALSKIRFIVSTKNENGCGFLEPRLKLKVLQKKSQYMYSQNQLKYFNTSTLRPITP